MSERFSNMQIKNPLAHFVSNLRIDKCHNTDIDFLIKNISANLHKSYGCSVALVQNQSLMLEQGRNNDVHIIGVIMIEYFITKICTVFDQCYQLFEVLCRPSNEKPKSNAEKYKILKNELSAYNLQTGHTIDFSWYKVVNAIRNRIIHGGHSIKSFSIGERVVFQSYNKEVDEMIPRNSMYSMVDKPLIYMDYFMNHYTSLIYDYVEDFSHLIIHITDSINFNKSMGEDRHIPDMIEQTSRYIHDTYVEIFARKRDEMKIYKKYYEEYHSV